jgi:hypothetical protein
MASDTKNKRGRPRKFTDETSALLMSQKDGSRRTKINDMYALFGANILIDDYPNYFSIISGITDIDAFKTGNRDMIPKGGAIFEQIGRMKLQDGYSMEIIIEVVKNVCEGIQSGAGRKEAANYVRHIRADQEQG